MKRLLFPLLCLLAFDAHAQERIRDLSLTPEETLREPDIKNGNNLGNYQSFVNQPADGNRPREGMPEASAMTPATRFMEGYCDPNFTPAVAGRGNLAIIQECVKQQKEKSCKEFYALPRDVQTVLDDAISCAYGDADAEAAATAHTDSTCADHDTSRLQLLQKYWKNSPVAASIVFLPDDVLNIANHCMRGGR